MLTLEFYPRIRSHWDAPLELCLTPLAAFMDFGARHGVPRYGTALRTWKKNARRLAVQSVTVVPISILV